MYVVLGANGRAGGETARALLDRGKPVRVFLRRPEQAEIWRKLGADIALGSIEDAPSLANALAGAWGAFLLCPPPESGDPCLRAEEFGRAIARSVRVAALPRVVALSSVGARHEAGTGVIAMLNILEKHLDRISPSTTFLRPGYFVETWGEVAQAAIADGELPSFLKPEQKIPMVSTIDVGRTAADLLCDDFRGQRVVELSGPQDWCAGDVAEAFGKVLGRRVAAAFVPPEARPAVLAEARVPPEVAQALLEMYDGLANGRVAFDDDLELRRGSVPLIYAVQRIVKTMATTADI
jgi:uncharacterized protein YbjT (DUF2867 family)